MALEGASARAVGGDIDVEIRDGEIVDRALVGSQFADVAVRGADLERRAVAVYRELVEIGDPYRAVYLVDGIGVEIDRPPSSISSSSSDSLSTSAAPVTEPTTGVAAIPAIAPR
ncbi:hypothetical protein [Halalkalicoccus salilacus]|uniref:hypothetical protein n=1 Tax=Halalkalicoccus sp. GCM10025704 TaxID=3252662 RepID=UPI0036F3FD54